jgi:hypothetical protein
MISLDRMVPENIIYTLQFVCTEYSMMLKVKSKIKDKKAITAQILKRACKQMLS